MPTPSNIRQGVGLSRRAWTRLNRLWTGVGRFGANILHWRLSTSNSCNCGAEQTAHDITKGRCPIYHTREGINNNESIYKAPYLRVIKPAQRRYAMVRGIPE